MRLLKDAYGEVYNRNENDPIDDLEIIREEILNLHRSFNEDTLKKEEDNNPNAPIERIVETLIGITNHFSTIESLGKIKMISEKYHNFLKKSDRL